MLRFIRKSMQNLRSFVTKIILGIVFFLLICVTSPILVYRQILAKFVPCFSKKLVKILAPQSQIYFSCEPRPALNVLIWFKVSGKLDFDLVKELIRTKCILIRNDSGDFVYPEFQQYPTMYGGYAFWKWEESFDMDKDIHHVTLDQEADAHAQFERTLQTPFPEKSSPWEFTFLEFGEKANCHFICFKFHHCLCDGVAIFDVLTRAADSEPHRLQFPEQPRTSCFDFFRRIFYFISSYFNFSYSATDKTPMIFDASNLAGVRHFPMSRLFDLGQAKWLGSKFNVSVWTAMMGLLTSAIRRKLQNEGKSVPDQMRCISSIMAPNHPKGLTNKVFMFDMTLPIGTPNVSERLNLLEAQAQAERKTNSTAVGFLMAEFVGSFPKRCMIPMFPANSIVVSIFPGPTKLFSIGGKVVEDMAYATNGGSHGLMVNIVSYNGTFRYWMGVDGKICSTEKSAIEFVDCIAHELDETTRSTGVGYELFP